MRKLLAILLVLMALIGIVAPAVQVEAKKEYTPYIVVELKTVKVLDDQDYADDGEIEIGTVVVTGEGKPQVFTWPVPRQDMSWHEANDGDTLIINAPIFSTKEDEIVDGLVIGIHARDNDQIPDWVAKFVNCMIKIADKLASGADWYIKAGIKVVDEIDDVILQWLTEGEKVGTHGKVLLPTDWDSGYLSVEETAGDMEVSYEIRRVLVPTRTPPVSVVLNSITGVDISQHDSPGFDEDELTRDHVYANTIVLNDLTIPEEQIQKNYFSVDDIDPFDEWALNKEIFRWDSVGPFLYIEIDVWEEDEPWTGDDHDMMGIYSRTFYPDENWGIGETVIEERWGIDEGDILIEFQIIGLPFYDVEVILSPAALEVEPGYTGTYTVTVTNLGNLEDTYSLSLDGLDPSWYAFSTTSVTLLSGDISAVDLHVTPARHWTTTPGDYDFSVTATSIYDPEASNSDPGVLTVLPFHEVEVFVVPDLFIREPGDTATFTVGVKNLGNVNDDYDVYLGALDYIEESWTTLWPLVFWDLDPGETDKGWLEIRIPVDWGRLGLESATDSFTVTATCQADPTAQKEATGTLTINILQRELSIDLSGELDYLWMENVKIQCAALVTDINTMEPLSNVDVAIEVYLPDGTLWVSDTMDEDYSGCYMWHSERTIHDYIRGARGFELQKGIYLVYVQASYEGGPTATKTLEFHLDPPAELSNVAIYYVIIVIMAAAAILFLARQLRHRRFQRLKLR